MYGYIYETTNLINGKKYIGQKKSDKFLGNKYLGSGKYLKQAVRKYGENSFNVKLLEKCSSEEELNQKEIYWINVYRNNNIILYNICDGGHYRFYNTGHVFSNEHREKISKAHKGKKLSEETKIKISKAQKGKKLSEETRTKMSISQKNRPKDNRGNTISKALIGHKVSKETRDKISQSQKTRFSNPEVRRKQSEASKKMMTFEVREKISKKCRGKKLSNKNKIIISKAMTGRKHITDGVNNKFIKLEELDRYLSNGWKLGQTNRR